MAKFGVVEISERNPAILADYNRRLAARGKRPVSKFYQLWLFRGRGMTPLDSGLRTFEAATARARVYARKHLNSRTVEIVRV